MSVVALVGRGFFIRYIKTKSLKQPYVVDLLSKILTSSKVKNIFFFLNDEYLAEKIPYIFQYFMNILYSSNNIYRISGRRNLSIFSCLFPPANVMMFSFSRHYQLPTVDFKRKRALWRSRYIRRDKKGFFKNHLSHASKYTFKVHTSAVQWKLTVCQVIKPKILLKGCYINVGILSKGAFCSVSVLACIHYNCEIVKPFIYQIPCVCKIRQVLFKLS